MAWSSGGDIVGGNVEVVFAGDMNVNGKIDGSSLVFLVSQGGSITIDGKIDGSSVVILVSTTGMITIGGKIDGSSNVTLKAPGDITIGTQGGDGDKKIDGSSHVEAVAGGNITLGSYIHSSTVDFSAHGNIMMTEIDGSAKVRHLADGDVSLKGKIDGSSVVDLVSNRGSVMVDGKIDGESKVSLTAGKDVRIGVSNQGGDGDHKIDGNSFVVAIAGGRIELGGPLHKDHTAVDFAAAGSIIMAKEISGGPTVRLLSGSGMITVTGGIDGSPTNVTYWPPAALTPTSNVVALKWAEPVTMPLTPVRTGYWWENWGQSFGYVAPFRIVPRSLHDIEKAIIGTGNVDEPDLTPVKAVGGGWSFTDASLPFTTQAEVDHVSIRKRGEWHHENVHNVLEGLTDNTRVRPMDLVPSAIARNLDFSTAYQQPKLRKATSSAEQLPASGEVRIIDTRSLASSLDCEFKAIRAETRRRRPHEILFHVEAGITMADLQQLLDHQHPRLAIRASGGSPGATLAGALSTATHGGEFNTALLVDCVRAVHLVGPGGEQWWIEGDVPVADQAKLQLRYPKIDAAHFIGAGWSAIPGLTAQDVLKAVAVSMGTMGVIYSMVLSVVPQFGLRQITHATTWSDLLIAAKASDKDLRAANVAANLSVLQVLMDGTMNGTGIKQAENVYVALAINPFNGDSWIVNRLMTPLPDDANTKSPAIGDYMSALSLALAGHAADTVGGSRVAGRMFDFLSWNTSWASIPNNVGQGARLADFVTRVSDVLVGAVATGNVQAVLNVINASGYKDRGHQFLGDVLTAFFHALEGTEPGINSDLTAVSYKVGAIGWPDGGVPGRGVEIALDPTNAFTFLQTVLFDDVLAKTMTAQNNPLIGYISIRVCPPTHTLMGMQQYSPHSVMIEVVAYRSPEGNTVMDEIQAKAIAWSPPSGPRPLLHWGLENDQVDSKFLAGTPLGQTYKAPLSRMDAFKKVREFLRNGNAPVFDNNFSARIGL